MSYFDPTRQQPAYQPAFTQQPLPPVQAYPVDEDGDRIYSEEDYAVQPDGDAFLPDEAEQTYYDPFAASASPLSYSGAFDSLNLQEDEDPQEDFADYDEEDYLTDEERRELSRSNWQLLAGLANFAGVIVGTAAILILIALLISLLNWLVSDISQTFILLQTPQ
ncbi:MAG: hypothetical protein IJ343_00820 [Clostridia bacterium]|nr:hypothetical protein [Clostridia bacterium]